MFIYSPEWLKWKRQKNDKCWQGCGEIEDSHTSRVQFDTVSLENF